MVTKSASPLKLVPAQRKEVGSRWQGTQASNSAVKKSISLRA